MEENKKEKFAITTVDFNRQEVGTPKVTEEFGKDDWIKIGANNDYYQELLRIYQNSDALHSALIKRKVDMIASQGFFDNTALNDLIKNRYSKEDLNKIAYKCAFDAVLFGGYALNIVWDAKGKSIAKIYHIPFEKVRVQKPQREDGEVSNYYISRDWLKPKKQENIPYLIGAFDFEDEQKRIEEPSQLLYTRIYSPGLDFYALPSYHSILNWLKLSYEISTYHLKSAQNSYMPGLIVSIPHMPNPQEREKTNQEIKARSGTDEAGKTIVVYGESKDNMPEFTILNPSTSDQKFEKLMQQINEEIYIGHASNNIVAGVSVAGKLGNSSEVKEQFGIFQKTVISPFQVDLESTFNRLAFYSGLPEEFKLKKYTEYIDEVPAQVGPAPIDAPGAVAPTEQPQQD